MSELTKPPRLSNSQRQLISDAAVGTSHAARVANLVPVVERMVAGAQKIGQAHASNLARQDLRKRIEAVHPSDGKYDVIPICEGCGYHYPCPTIRALEGS